ncbi:Quinol oxidase subunit 3 [Paraconexibacter sp. AEG42_29]|uniref:Cytochrome aa3 subunit 3 n=2 Tax=Paraconexibacter sp. AEG42_29 TaxID=2997339 RepID=A0AAU7B193_9ACTN
MFILGDLTIFAALFIAYLYNRGEQPAEFARSQQTLTQAFGAVNTLLLLASSLLVVMTVRAVRIGRARLAPPLLYGALVCGIAFSINKIIEYSNKLDHGLDPATNDFYMYFYVLTGVHFVHLLVGMGLLGMMIALSKRSSLSKHQSFFFEGAACFWHMVDLLWIVLFPLLYLVH